MRQKRTERKLGKEKRGHTEEKVEGKLKKGKRIGETNATQISDPIYAPKFSYRTCLEMHNTFVIMV